MSPRAFGGGELQGDQLVRFAYLDESGTGNPVKEPFVVLAGFAIDADKQWKMLEQYLSAMADEFACPEDRDGFYFHAVELMNGGKQITREKYPKEKRHRFLQALCEIPEKFGLPVVMSCVERARFPLEMDGKKCEKDAIPQALQVLSGSCAAMLDDYMHQHAEPSEVASLIYEKNSKLVSDRITEHHAILRSHALDNWRDEMGLRNWRQISRIVETALFAAKTDSSPLQVADACAYILGRRRGRVKGDERFYEPLRRQMFRCPSTLFADLESRSTAG